MNKEITFPLNIKKGSINRIGGSGFLGLTLQLCNEIINRDDYYVLHINSSSFNLKIDASYYIDDNNLEHYHLICDSNPIDFIINNVKKEDNAIIIIDSYFILKEEQREKISILQKRIKESNNIVIIIDALSIIDQSIKDINIDNNICIIEDMLTEITTIYYGEKKDKLIISKDSIFVKNSLKRLLGKRGEISNEV